jgi:P-type E1-E2 ATPase
LTYGTPKVVEVRPCPDISPEHLIETAAIAEKPSEHPLGRAILRKASEMSLPTPGPKEFNYAPGKGIICSSDGEEIIVGNSNFLTDRNIHISEDTSGSDHLSEVFVARNGRFLGVISIADVLRPEAVEAVHAIRQMGIRSILLTGDASPVANAIGQELGVDEVHAELLPDQKLTKVRALMNDGRKVAMIGDGINDAPALMQSDVGVAMGSGTDVAQESSSVVLIGNDLLKIVEVLRISKWCRRIIMTNFTGTLLVDGVGVGLAAFGLLNPMLAAFVHVSSELVFILNSARLFPAISKNGFGKMER